MNNWDFENEIKVNRERVAQLEEPRLVAVANATRVR